VSFHSRRFANQEQRFAYFLEDVKWRKLRSDLRKQNVLQFSFAEPGKALVIPWLSINAFVSS
jgi:hypothetical protein